MTEPDRRLAQFVLTSHLFGVDAVPIRTRAAPAASAPAEGPSPARAERPRPAAGPPTVEIETVRRPAPARPAPAPAASGADTAARLADLEARYEDYCPPGTIATEHTRVVFGEGDPNARLLFVGEAPGADEDRLGRPFVGRAGQKLDEIIGAMGLDRSTVYITNIVKIRPPGNRTPLQSELDACFPLLAAQIDVIRPEVIVTLGGPSTKTLLATRTGITKLRGVWAEYHDPDRDLRVPVMPTFHPAFLLRQYTAENRGLVWSDMKAVLARLGLKAPKRG